MYVVYSLLNALGMIDSSQGFLLKHVTASDTPENNTFAFSGR